MGRLDGKVIFLTGGGGGIGTAATRRFVAEGAKVAVVDVKADVAEAAVASLGTAAGSAIAIACDIGDDAQVQDAVARTVAAFGRLDVLYNNAGGSSFRDGPVTDVPEDEFQHVMRTEVWGLFVCARHAIPEIRKQGGGAVINTTSIFATKGYPGRDCYTAAKGAISAVTRSMAVEFAPDRIRVNAIAPSITLTPRVKAMMDARPDFASLAEGHLLGLGQPEDVAEMAVYLASDEARIVTGQVLAVDSGANMH